MAEGQRILDQLEKSLFLTYSKPAQEAHTPLESAGKIFITDLIGEGPIDGPVNRYGEKVLPNRSQSNNDELLKGVYYNDTVVKDGDTDLFNYNLASVNMNFGSSVQESFESSSRPLALKDEADFSFANSCVTYGYDKPLFGLDGELPSLITNSLGSPFVHHSLALSVANKKINAAKTREDSGWPVVALGPPLRPYEETRLRTYEEAKEICNKLFTPARFAECFGVTHEIKDANTRYLILTFRINSLSVLSKKGHTLQNNASFGISIRYKDDPDSLLYLTHHVRGVATAPYQFDLYLDVSDFNMKRIPVVQMYNFTQRVGAKDPKNQRSVSMVSVTEVHKAKLYYPFSAVALNEIDARSVSQVPNRSYDLRLLKVKVPNNYDPETKEYWGTWNGEFDPVLRWTDNPAWILYDVLSNQRYGLGKYTKDTYFLNKWSAYEIAKFCDGMVATNNASKYVGIGICDIGGEERNRNTVCISWDAGSSNLAGVSFEEVFSANQANGEKTVVSLLSLKFYDPIAREYYFKSFKGYLTGIDRVKRQIYVAKMMGADKIRGSFSGNENELEGLDSEEIIRKQYSDVLRDNTSSPLSKFSQGLENTSTMSFLDEDDLPFFTEEELINYVPESGLAHIVFSAEGYLDLLEPRFRANIYLTEDTQIFDLVNNIASIFRGIAYWNNFVVNFSSDKKDFPVYAFTNTNVKDGVFGYSGSSKDNRFTVCKVVYSDETDNFRDKTIYVEDYRGIRDYGYIEREILGFGITSETQARRIGRWFLLTNQIERDVVSFTTGQEASLLNVGNIIKISDQYKLSGPKAGRISSVDAVNRALTLDNKYDFIKPNDGISVQIARAELDDLKVISSDQTKKGYLYNFIVDEVEVSVTDDDFRTQVTLQLPTLEDKQAFAQIRNNSLWFFEEKYGSDFTYFKEYRIAQIKEKENGEFDIVASEYNISKFDYMEFDKPLIIPALIDEEGGGASELSNTDFIPTDLLSQVNDSTIFGDAEDKQDIDFLYEALLGDGPAAGFHGEYTSNYDYLFCAEFLEKSSYAETFYSATLSLSSFYSECLNREVITSEQDKNIIGLLASFSLSGKRVSFRWLKEDAKTQYTVVYSKRDYRESAVDITVYKIGKDYQLLT